MYCLSLTLPQSWSYVTCKNLLAIFMQLELYGQVLTKQALLSRHFNVVRTHARFLSVLLCINRVFRYTHFQKRCLWTRICSHRSHRLLWEIGVFFLSLLSILWVIHLLKNEIWLNNNDIKLNLLLFCKWASLWIPSENYLSPFVFASCLYKNSCSIYLEHIGSNLRKCIIW